VSRRERAPLRAPFPYFGGKSRVAPIVWRAFGDTANYVEPFFGSGAVLLGRPTAPRIETVNDRDCWVANFWRAVRSAPEEVAEYADAPVNEADLHARHSRLHLEMEEHRESMLTDPDYFDARKAGWWVWGMSAWIGSGWCSEVKNPSRKIPQLVNGGQGVHQRFSRQMPSLNGPARGVAGKREVEAWFVALAERFRKVRVLCGDWRRVLGNTVIGTTGTRDSGMNPCGVFLDPPYARDGRDRVHGVDEGIAPAVAEWAAAHGTDSDLRIALCCYEGDVAMPADWTCHAWKANRGYASEENTNAARERVYFSPHCLPIDEQRSLFAGVR